MNLNEFIHQNDVECEKNLVSEEGVQLAGAILDTKMGPQLTEYLLRYGSLSFGEVDFCGLNAIYGMESSMMVETDYFREVVNNLNGYIVLEHTFRDECTLVDSNDNVFEYSIQKNLLSSTKKKLFDYILMRLEKEKQLMEKKVVLDEATLAKIKRYAEREGKVIASKFRRFASAIQNTDFSYTNPRSIHEVRDIIVHLAEVYGLRWEKFDSCDDWWYYGRNFKIDHDYFTFYSVGFEVDYFDIPTAEFSNRLPRMVIEKALSMTADKVISRVEEAIVENIKTGNYSH